MVRRLAIHSGFFATYLLEGGVGDSDLALLHRSVF